MDASSWVSNAIAAVALTVAILSLVRSWRVGERDAIAFRIENHAAAHPEYHVRNVGRRVLRQFEVVPRVGSPSYKVLVPMTLSPGQTVRLYVTGPNPSPSSIQVAWRTRWGRRKTANVPFLPVNSWSLQDAQL